MWSPRLHAVEGGEPIDAVSLKRVIRSVVVFDLTPVDAGPKCVGCDFFEEPAARSPGSTRPRRGRLPGWANEAA
jgi:kynurenine formamidase